MIAPKTAADAILHPADPTANGGSAFAHALKIALKTKRPLSLLHVSRVGEAGRQGSGLDAVVAMLIRWRMLAANARASALRPALGLDVNSVGMPANGVRAGILDYLDTHPCELAVLATHAHKGLGRWLEPSLRRAALRKAHTMMLFLREGERGFVDAARGDLRLNKVLVPLDNRIDSVAAVSRIVEFVEELGANTEIRLLHVGADPPPPPRPGLAMTQRDGPVAATILDTAERWSADLIAMPTAGRHGLLGALRGSVTAEILEDARWPVLSVPAP